jgi:hypothetical protein
MARARPRQGPGEPLKPAPGVPTVPCQNCPRGQVPLVKRGGFSMGSCTTCGRTYGRLLSATPRAAR